MTIRRELIDELLKEYETPQDILGEGGLLRELTKAVIERVSRKRNWRRTWATQSMDARIMRQAIPAMDRVRKH